MPFWMAFWANHFGAFFAHVRNQWLSRSAEVRSSEDAMGLIYGFVWKFRGILGSLIFLEPQVPLLKWPFHWRYPIVRPRKKNQLFRRCQTIHIWHWNSGDPGEKGVYFREIPIKITFFWVKFRISRSAEPCVPGGPVVERCEPPEVVC